MPSSCWEPALDLTNPSGRTSADVLDCRAVQRRLFWVEIPRYGTVRPLAVPTLPGRQLAPSASAPESSARPILRRASPARPHLEISRRKTRSINNPPTAVIMAKAKKSRIINIRLVSMAMTGFTYHFKRPRAAKPLGLLKYDPIGMPFH